MNGWNQMAPVSLPNGSSCPFGFDSFKNAQFAFPSIIIDHFCPQIDSFIITSGHKFALPFGHLLHPSPGQPSFHPSIHSKHLPFLIFIILGQSCRRFGLFPFPFLSRPNALFFLPVWVKCLPLPFENIILIFALFPPSKLAFHSQPKVAQFWGVERGFCYQSAAPFPSLAGGQNIIQLEPQEWPNVGLGWVGLTKHRMSGLPHLNSSFSIHSANSSSIHSGRKEGRLPGPSPSHHPLHLLPQKRSSIHPSPIQPIFTFFGLELTVGGCGGWKEHSIQHFSFLPWGPFS